MSVYETAQSEARRVFISYSSLDRIRTNGLGLLLEGLGHQVFHDHRTIKPGMKWEAALQDGLDQADSLMVFWTRHAARSDWVRKEYEYFYSTYPDRPLVPVMGDETPLPEILKTRQAADFAPIVNEVLEMKRTMKKQGASASEVERAVIQRLDDAGVEIKSKKQRKMLGLFLGFNWLFLLFRHPLQSAGRAGRGAVEKTAQMTAGQIAAIGVAAVVGLAAGGPVADGIRRATQVSQPPVALSSDTTMMGDVDLRPMGSAGDGGLALAESLLSFRNGLLESHDTINVRLDEIDRRLDQLSLGGSESLDACVRDSDELADKVANLQIEVSRLRTQLEERGATVIPPPNNVEGSQRIVYVPVAAAGAIVDPVPVDTPYPVYPEQARRDNVEGTVNVWATIRADGSVAVDSVFGRRVLAAAARRAVSEWRFRAGTSNGEPVVRQFMVPVVFDLTGRNPRRP